MKILDNLRNKFSFHNVFGKEEIYVSFSLFLQQFTILFFIAMIGFIATVAKVFKEKSEKVFMQLILYVTLPALIIHSMNFPLTTSITTHFLLLIFFSILALIISTFIAHLLSKQFPLSPSQEGVFKSLLIFGNQGFIGYATLYLVYGDMGIMYGAIYNIPYLFYIWSYGFYIVAYEKQKPSFMQFIFNPGIVATLIGVILFMTQVQLPPIVSNTLQQVGMMTVPLSMITIGCIVGSVCKTDLLKMILNKNIWIAQLVKLFLVPIIFIPFAAFGISSIVIVVAILLSSMPSAPTTILVAEKYNADKRLATVGVTLSTLLSMFTIPFIYWLFMHFFM